MSGESWTGNTSAEWRDGTGTAARRLAGLVRRLAVKVTSGTFWQVVGHLLFDNKTPETLDAEVFSGGGFYWRPKAGANAEAIVVFPGGPENPVIVGMRDEDLRKKMAQIAQDEACMVNTQAGVFITNQGFVEARQDGGTAVGLALESELNNLRGEYERLLAAFNAQFTGAGHVHGVSGAATNSTLPAPPAAPTSAPTAYPGTQVLLGE
jgi:hypothetical protein